MAGLSQEEFDKIAEEIRTAWGRAGTRDEGFQVILDYGRKVGYKNVIAAIEQRKPKRFTREKPLSEWIEDQSAASGAGDG